MRRSEKDELAQTIPPGLARLFAIAAGAARDETAHTMADDHEILNFHGPFGEERLQRVGEGAAVDRDVQARIVGEIDRRIAEFVRERRAVVVILRRPLQVAQAKPVHEHCELARGVRERLGERGPVELERPSAAAKPHRERERIAGRGEVVADDAVEGGERDLPSARRRTIVRLRVDQRRSAADPLAGQLQRAADAPIDELRHAAGHALTDWGDTRRREDGIVHLLDNSSHAVRRFKKEAAEAEDIRRRNSSGFP